MKTPLLICSPSARCCSPGHGFWLRMSISEVWKHMKHMLKYVPQAQVQFALHSGPSAFPEKIFSPACRGKHPSSLGLFQSLNFVFYPVELLWFLLTQLFKSVKIFLYGCSSFWLNHFTQFSVMHKPGDDAFSPVIHRV